jgi:hypothetical protein
MTKTGSQVIYARVPTDVRDAVGTYADQQGATIAGAVTTLLRRGLANIKAEDDAPSRPIPDAALDAIAAGLTERLQLAIVQEIPQQLLDAMAGPSWESFQPFHMIAPSCGVLRVERQGNILTIEFQHNGYRAARFRFEGSEGEACEL